MASENPEPPSPPNTKEASNQSAKKRSQTQKRPSAAQMERERRRAMIDECHVQSLFGLDMILQDGITKTIFTNYMGEHQSQIFYGGFDIQRPNKPNVHIALGQPTPIDLGNSDGGSAVCLAVPTYIFRRFPSSEKPVSSASSSDSKNPPSPLSGIFPNCTPKNGLCLVTFKIYFSVNFMASANNVSSRVRCGKEANLRYTPRFNEFVEYHNEPQRNASISKLNQNRLTMEINEFVRRVLLSHQNLNLLRAHSMEFPDFSVFSATEQVGTVHNSTPSSPDVIPTFLVLPHRTYMRIAALKNRLNLGWKSLPPSNMGIPMRLTKTDSAQRDPADKTLTWVEWTGVKEALTLPPDVVSKIISCDKSLEVRIVFIRRTSGDCGKAISQVIRECQLEPARIRRIKSKDSDAYKFLKIRQLVLTDKVKEYIGVDSENVSRKSLEFQEVWSRDTDSNPYILGLNAKALSSIRSVKPTVNELFGDLSSKRITKNGGAGAINANTANYNTLQSNVEGQQQSQQRPSRSHMPPQRLQMADSDLIRAIHKSLAEKNAVNGTEMSSLAKARNRRQKTTANESLKQGRIKRTHSEAELIRIGRQATVLEVEHNRLNTPPPPSSPSATSDSALSIKISRKGEGKRKRPYERTSSGNKCSSSKRRKVDGQEPVKETTTPESGDCKAKSGSSAWSYAKKRQSIKKTTKISKSNPVTLESSDPYALPLSPVDSFSVPPNNVVRSPSPDPPVLVPEGKLQDCSFDLPSDSNGNDSVSKTNKEKHEEVMNRNRLSPVLDNHRDSEVSDNGTSSSPPTLSMYSSNTEQSTTNGEKSHSPNSNFQLTNNCPSNGLPQYALSQLSTLQQHPLQPAPSSASEKFSSQTILASSVSFHIPVNAPQAANASNNPPDQQQQSVSIPNSNAAYHFPHSFWNGDLGNFSSISQPATMWTLRETPLPAPDNNNNPSEGTPRLLNPAVTFPRTFIPTGPIVQIPTIVTPNITLVTQSPQSLMNALNTSSLTPEMAAFFNYYTSFMSASSLLNPSHSSNNGQSPMTLHSNPLSMSLSISPTVANITPWNSSNHQRGGGLL